MQGTLVVAVLSVRSSYIQGIEAPLAEPETVPDTLQWWISTAGSWRIRTYAIDHDIHTYSLNTDHPDLLNLARAHTLKHYGKIISAQHEIQLVDCANREVTDVAMRNSGLEPRLEVAPGRFAFWKPDDARYYTRSSPN